MTFLLTVSAIRRHLMTVILTGLLVAFTANLLHVPAPMLVAAWLGGAFLSFEVWYALEPLALRWIWRCRRPTAVEQQRLDAAPGLRQLNMLVADRDVAAARGLRCIVISRDLLDLLEDRALTGFLMQVAAPVQAANLAGFALVWLGNLPLRGAGLLGRLFGRLGELLALVIGKCLVLPLALWPDGFVRWAGRLFASVGIGLIGSSLLINGFPAVGFLLMVAWLAIPGLNALLVRESRASERIADRATIEAGYGFQLLEAVDLLGLADPTASPSGALALLRRPGAPSVDRARWLRRALQGWATVN